MLLVTIGGVWGRGGVPAQGTGDWLQFAGVFGMVAPEWALVGVWGRCSFQGAFRILGLGTTNVHDGGRAPILQNHLGGKVNPYAAPFRR